MIQQKVHIDSAEECVKLFTESLVFAGLGKLEGDQLKLAFKTANGDMSAESHAKETNLASDTQGSEGDSRAEETQKPGAEPTAAPLGESGVPTIRSKSIPIQVTLSIDPTMDPEKLEKHLRLLRAYGIC